MKAGLLTIFFMLISVCGLTAGPFFAPFVPKESRASDPGIVHTASAFDESADFVWAVGTPKKTGTHYFEPTGESRRFKQKNGDWLVKSKWRKIKK